MTNFDTFDISFKEQSLDEKILSKYVYRNCKRMFGFVFIFLTPIWL